MITFAVLGLGNRGSVYCNNLIKHEGVKIVAACDVSEASLKQANELYGVQKSELYLKEEEFFKKKRADVLIISTLDGLHCRHTVKALELGYKILLEKPVAPTLAECEEIYAAAKKYNGDVVICHNLRYTPFYQKFKTLIKSGVIGDVLSIEQAENVSYWHYMCSFIRGKWHSKQQTSPIILQKCCHDLDIISWFAGKKETFVNSFGALEYYTHANRPKGATERCLDCEFKDCIYNAFEFSVKAPGTLCVPYGFNPTPENIAEFLRPENNLYGQCAFACPNDVCDRQCVNIKTEGDITANLLMHGFGSYETYRVTRVFGTLGKLCGRLEDGIIRVTLFDGRDYTVDLNAEIANPESHSGGDSNLVSDYLTYLKTGERPLGISELSDSLQSHRLAFNAETARLKNVVSGDNSVDYGNKQLAYNNTHTAADFGDFSGLAGVYKQVAECFNGGKNGAVQTVSITANHGAENLKANIKRDLAFAEKLIGSKAFKCESNISLKCYPHGFITVFYSNGAILRYSFTASPLCEKVEISAFSPKLNAYADSEKSVIIIKGAALEDKEQTQKINEKSACDYALADETIIAELENCGL